MQENLKQKEGIESEHDAEEPETKEGIESGHNVGEPETKEGIKSRHNAGKPKKKRRKDRIQARCRSARNKMKRSNSSMMLENLKQKKGSNLGTMPENPK